MSSVMGRSGAVFWCGQCFYCWHVRKICCATCPPHGGGTGGERLPGLHRGQSISLGQVRCHALSVGPVHASTQLGRRRGTAYRKRQVAMTRVLHELLAREGQRIRRAARARQGLAATWGLLPSPPCPASLGPRELPPAVRPRLRAASPPGGPVQVAVSPRKRA